MLLGKDPVEDPLSETQDEALLRRLEIGIDNIEVNPRGIASQNIIEEWRSALIRRMAEQDLYLLEPGEVTVRSDQLFRTRISFPSNVPTGVYRATVYQINFAHDQAGLYGLVAVLLALGAGWLSHIAFRRN